MSCKEKIMRIRFLKSVGILFSLALMVASFLPMNAQAAPGCDHMFDWYDASETTHLLGCLFCGERHDEPHTFIAGKCSTCGYLNMQEASGCNHSFSKYGHDTLTHECHCSLCYGFYYEPHTVVNEICSVCENYVPASTVGTTPATAECAHDWYVDVATPGDAYVHAIVCGKCGVGGANVHVFANGVDGVCLECGAEIIDSSSYAAVYDASYYAEANPDLKAVFGDNEDLLFGHFIACGMAEGRQGSEEFNVHAYRAYYPDLVAVFGDDLASYYQHYMNSGKAEGRVAR